MASTIGLRCLCTSSERTNPWRGENRPSALHPPYIQSAGRGAKVGRTRGSRIDRLMDIRMNKALCGTHSGFKNQETGLCGGRVWASRTRFTPPPRGSLTMTTNGRPCRAVATVDESTKLVIICCCVHNIPFQGWLFVGAAM
ncbi:hypothetical protein E4U61_005285 [Claviceps capensis]|nr:hypothetical protein E4U61_005285 [Claviceps capensis]